MAPSKADDGCLNLTDFRIARRFETRSRKGSRNAVEAEVLLRGSAPEQAAATKPAAKKAVALKPPVGLPGEAFLRNLKKAPPRTTGQRARHGDALRSLPPDQLKAALVKVAAKERSLLFSVIPGDQIKSIIGSLPSSVLAPPTQPVPTPFPSPTGGPPASILQTTYANVPYPPAAKDPNWSEKISNGSTLGLTSPPPWEWVSVYDPRFEKEGSLNNPMVGLTGWVVDPALSQGDVWFVHPFGFDFEFYIVPDPQYESLLAASNTGITPGTGARSTRISLMRIQRPQTSGFRLPKACSAWRPTRASCRRRSAI